MLHVNNQFLSLKAIWMKKILESEENWSYIDKNIIENLGGKNVICNISSTDQLNLNKIPPFYRQILESVAKINAADIQQPKTLVEILEMPLWGNKYITQKVGRHEKTLYYENWIQSNFTYVKDLKFTNGKLDENFCYKNVKKKNNILAETLSINRP